MRQVLRLMVALCGLVLLVVGLGALGSGGVFALSSASGRDLYGLGLLSIVLVFLGGVLIWVAWLVLKAAARRPSVARAPVRPAKAMPRTKASPPRVMH